MHKDIDKIIKQLQLLERLVHVYHFYYGPDSDTLSAILLGLAESYEGFLKAVAVNEVEKAKRYYHQLESFKKSLVDFSKTYHEPFYQSLEKVAIQPEELMLITEEFTDV